MYLSGGIVGIEIIGAGLEFLRCKDWGLDVTLGFISTSEGVCVEQKANFSTRTGVTSPSVPRCFKKFMISSVKNEDKLM